MLRLRLAKKPLDVNSGPWLARGLSWHPRTFRLPGHNQARKTQPILMQTEIFDLTN